MHNSLRCGIEIWLVQPREVAGAAMGKLAALLIPELLATSNTSGREGRAGKKLSCSPIFGARSAGSSPANFEFPHGVSFRVPVIFRRRRFTWVRG
jgi:hypothetical protein